MPPWCQGDAILAERIEELVALTKALREGEGAFESLLAPLAADF